MLQPGEELDVYALAKGVRCQADSFLMSLPRAERRALRALLKRTADHGTPRNTELFKHEEGKTWVFRHRKGARLYCFMASNADKPTIVITHGVKKKQDKARASDLRKANTDRQIFIEGGSHYDIQE